MYLVLNEEALLYTQCNALNLHYQQFIGDYDDEIQVARSVRHIHSAQQHHHHDDSGSAPQDHHQAALIQPDQHAVMQQHQRTSDPALLGLAQD